MSFLLTYENAYEYLIKHKIYQEKENNHYQIECKSSKNFNVLITLPSQHYLVKQEHHNEQGQTKGELEKEWQIHNLFKTYTELNYLALLTSEAIYFDSDSSIMVLNYLDDYYDLREFYWETNQFPLEIATRLGEAIAKIHRSTLEKTTYQNYFSRNYGYYDQMNSINNLIEDLEESSNNQSYQFFELYQRYPSLKQALKKVNSLLDPCCLIHNDLKLNNILVKSNWQQDNQNHSLVKIIDWEKWSWGDPTVDLGSILGSYLRIWLKSLIISKNIDLKTALNTATTPLETIQPSLVSLIKSYVNYFPEILTRYDHFLTRLMQFIGLALLNDLEIDLLYQEPFTNNSICMLQVAKTLLCTPRESIPAILGVNRIDS